MHQLSCSFSPNNFFIRNPMYVIFISYHFISVTYCHPCWLLGFYSHRSMLCKLFIHVKTELMKMSRICIKSLIDIFNILQIKDLMVSICGLFTLFSYQPTIPQFLFALYSVSTYYIQCHQNDYYYLLLPFDEIATNIQCD